MDADGDVERSWLRQIALGDKAAFERLYRAYARRLFGYLKNLVGPAEAEDVLADVMFEVWRSARRYSGEGEPRSWMFAIASNLAKKRLRSGERDGRARERLLRVVPASPRTPDDAFARHEEAQHIEAALGELSAEHREVLWLTFQLGLSQAEIADVAGVPLGTVKSRVFHAKADLRAALEAADRLRATS